MSANNYALIHSVNGKWYVWDNLNAEEAIENKPLSIKDAKEFDLLGEAVQWANENCHAEYGYQISDLRKPKDGYIETILELERPITASEAPITASEAMAFRRYEEWLKTGLPEKLKQAGYMPIKEHDKVVEELRSTLMDMINQFAYDLPGPSLWPGGLSALEGAFDVLELKNPYPIPDQKCEVGGCFKRATCGTPTKDGYKRLCGEHFSEQQK